MSGTKTKTARQQKPTDSSGTAPSTSVAPLIEGNGNGHEPAIVLPGHDIQVGSQPFITGSEPVDGPVLSASAAAAVMGVDVLLVQAVSPNGFYRCGRFWPFDGVHVFVSADPDSDNAECQLDDGTPLQPFISRTVAERLKGDSNLRVTVEQVAAEPAEDK